MGVVGLVDYAKKGKECVGGRVLPFFFGFACSRRVKRGFRVRYAVKGKKGFSLLAKFWAGCQGEGGKCLVGIDTHTRSFIRCIMYI